MTVHHRKQRLSWAIYILFVALFHLVGLLFVTLSGQSEFLSLGFLAYTLGLRHAFDADHISAIDNTVRKLLQEGKNPNGVGFYFSVGHSSVVCIMTLVTVLAVKWAQQRIPFFERMGGLVGTSISGLFLLLIGLMNLFIFVQISRVFIQMRRDSHDAADVQELLELSGPIFRFVRPMMRFVSQSWHVLPIGFLFGLGFDTASEIALLGISAGAIKSSVSATGILGLPLLFAAGMSLLDTLDGFFMTKAYYFAFSTPLRKVYYNLTVTGLAVAAALFVGGVEIGQVILSRLHVRGGFWKWAQSLDIGSIGYVLVILFALAWAISFGLWKLLRVEQRWSAD